MFGDNQSVVTSSTIPHSPLTKRWTALSYHRVQEAIASKILQFFHIPGEENPADIASKHWSRLTRSFRLKFSLPCNYTEFVAARTATEQVIIAPSCLAITNLLLQAVRSHIHR